jgi:eukaryotic-like serine/threonine-protein kinase
LKIKLTVISGPHQGKEFEFDGHDTLLVGRSSDAHLQLPHGDPYFSRRHFVVEVNPPRCRLIDLNSRNGTLKNGARVQVAEVADGDEIGAGHTVFKVRILSADPDRVDTLDLPVPPLQTIDYLDPEAISVPGFLMERELGRGAMGIVYRAVRTSDGQPVALKTIRPATGATQKQIDRFLRESRILAQLDHKNIVAFREVGQAGRIIFLAMELIDGPDLRTILQDQGPLDVCTAVRIVCQVLGGVAHAHAKGFVHRDIKPANILISRVETRRVAKLADFGLARVYESSKISGLTMQGEIGGTPAFMAPEQVTHYRQVKPAADQYSVAATLYNVLTGHYTHDFPKEVPAQLAHLVSAEPIPIRNRRNEIPAELAAVIHKALGREPSDRFRDILAFRKALLAFA